MIAQLAGPLSHVRAKVISSVSRDERATPALLHAEGLRGEGRIKLTPGSRYETMRQ